MPKNFSRDMINVATNPSAKLILFSDLPCCTVNDCPNCGGLGFFNIFVASDGPFKEPMFPYNGSSDDHKTSHWYNGYWWSGKSYNFPCPDCNGSGEVDGTRARWAREEAERGQR
jgi:hypothetical protein